MKLTVIILGLILGGIFLWIFGAFRLADRLLYNDIRGHYTAQEARYHQGPPPPFNPNARLTTGKTLRRAEGGPAVSVPAGTPIEDFGNGEVRIVLTDTKTGKIWFDRIATFASEEGE